MRSKFVMLSMLGLAFAHSLLADVTGTVFRDYNANGSRDMAEPGIAGIAVNIFDGTGLAVGNSPQITAPDGTYTLTGLPTGPLRIEMTPPIDGSLGFLEPGAAGATSVVFTTDGSTVDVGFNNPAQFCQADPLASSACFITGDPLPPGSAAGALDALVSWPISLTGNTTPPNDVAFANEVGTVWGLAWNRADDILYASAVLRRHSGVGPDGMGAIYAIDMSTPSSPVVSSFMTVSNVGLDPRTEEGSTLPTNPSLESIDTLAFGATGKRSLGDLEISEDDSTLYVINLNTRSLVEIDIASASETSSTPITDPGCAAASDVRPFGLKVLDDEIYVGVVCSAQSTGDQVDLDAYVMRKDGSSFVSIFGPIDLDPISYPRSDAFNPTAGNLEWFAWVDTFMTTDPPPGFDGADVNSVYPQPILTDIEFDSIDGSMILAFTDRQGMQTGALNLSPDGTLTVQTIAAGDILRVCRDSSGAFVLENAGLCEGQGSGTTAGDGPGGGEYYDEDNFTNHKEVILGGLSHRAGDIDVLATIYDPFAVRSAGTRFFDNTSGGTVSSFQIFSTDQTGTLGKATGLGDVELLCAPAPVEIGNRVWCDAPMAGDMPNGIQDPVGAAGIPDTVLPGVVVALSCDGGAVTATTMTAADGSYLFSDANVAGGIPYGATCLLSIDTVANAGALGTCIEPTFANVGSPTDPGQDLRDSDGTDLDINGVIEVTVIAGGPGENNHSVDFGLRIPPVPILTATKADVVLPGGDNDGMLDPGDTLRYTVVITNSGDADSTATVFTSSIDANASLVGGSVTTTQGTITTGNTPGDTSVAVDIGTLVQAGGTVTLTYDVMLNDPVGADVTEILCQGTISASNHPTLATDDPDPSVGDTDPTDTPVDAAPDISASKIDALLVDVDFDGRVDAGDTVRYTVVIDNNGNQDASAASFLSNLDPNTTLAVGSVTNTQGTITSGNTGGDTAVGVDLGTVAGTGGSVTITYDVTVNTPIPAGVTQISCQGTTVGDNFPGTMTDDPDDPSPNDATDTPLDLGMDFGDAPDSYTTTASPSHEIDAAAGIFLGACVDAESAGQPAPAGTAADGDDLNDLGTPPAVLGTCAGNDDEDGITFDTMIMACSATNQVTVTSAGTGLLDAWIDFDGNGDFSGLGEQIFTSQALTGSDVLSYSAPCSTASGLTYARFRVSSAGGLGSDGAAADGEVEDYQVTTKGLDYGDAPDTYTTTVSPNHLVDPGSVVYLGSCVDTEAAGAPSSGADGDDLTAGISTLGSCTGIDDEDGVTFDTMIVACSTTNQITVTSVGGGLLDAWIDFDGSGTFVGTGEQIFSSQALTGNDVLTFTAPCSTTGGNTYARFRVSTAGGLPFDGSAMDGEVEDYAVTTKEVDYGDAPDTYGTTMATNGPSHAIVDGFLLGTLEDGETDGQPNAAADGDDTTNLADEDGVAFPNGMAMAGICTTGNALTVTLTNTAGIPTAQLDAWIDWNGDGDFDNPTEHLFGGTTAVLSAGPNALSYDVPCNAVEQAISYARFRLSSIGGLMPTDAGSGPAMDGEVEDYTFQVKGLDFGDAPDSYGTVLASDGPRHTVVPGYLLGTEEDSEMDGQPNATADGDDTNGTDDEDGVAFANAMAMAGACSTGNGLTVTLTNTAGIATARLDAWIDWNGDGDFDNPAEHLFGGISANLAAGPNALTYDVPCDAMEQAVSYARFRLSSAGNQEPTTPAAANPAADGEVEDYTFQVKGVDFGDAPDSYDTTLAAGGPSHTIVPGYSLGASEDTEPDGQPSPNADGDDTDADGDDEDGITFSGDMAMAHACEDTDLMALLTDTASIGTALLDAWIDFNGDGDFDHPAEHLFGGTSAPLTAGPNTLAYTVPCDVETGDTYARFRLSSTGGLTPADGGAGPVADGEVEDYAFLLKGLDWGDAPAPYSTTSADNGPWHVLVPTNNPTLGAVVDNEADGQPDADHLGDDNAGTPDDEDGVSLPAMVLPGGVFDVDVTALNGGVLNAWVDFNGNGVFGDDPAEQIATDMPLTAGTTTLPGLMVPPTSPDGLVCARFRYSTQTGIGPTGGATDGEIEDYGVIIEPENAMVGAAKELDIETLLDNGDGTFTFTYNLIVENFGNIQLDSVQLATDLATAYEAALSYSVDLVTSSVNLTVNGGFDGDGDTLLLDGTDSLDVGEQGFIDITMTVDPGQNAGPYFCSAAVTATSTAGTDVADMSQDGNDPDPDTNGNPTDDDEPTPITFDIFEIVEIPTLGEWSLALLALMLLLYGTFALRRRKT